MEPNRTALIVGLLTLALYAVGVTTLFAAFGLLF